MVMMSRSLPTVFGSQIQTHNLRVNGAGLDGFFNMIMDKSSASTSDYITVRKGSGGNTAVLTRLTHEGLWEPQVAAPVAGDPSRTHAPQHGSAVVDARQQPLLVRHDQSRATVAQA